MDARSFASLVIVQTMAHMAPKVDFAFLIFMIAAGFESSYSTRLRFAGPV